MKKIKITQAAVVSLRIKCATSKQYKQFVAWLKPLLEEDDNRWILYAGGNASNTLHLLVDLPTAELIKHKWDKNNRRVTKKASQNGNITI